MAFQTPITISKALGSIERREYVLPAIQREFVWSRPLPARFSVWGETRGMALPSTRKTPIKLGLL